MFWLAIAAACGVFILLALPLSGTRFYTFDDLGRYHLPFRFFYAQSMAAGDSFIWLPNIYCGFYLHGDGSVGMLHPLHLLLYKTLPFTIAFNWEILLNYPLMLVGMFLFLRRWKMPRGASMLGAIVFAFSGFNILHFTHINAVVVAAHIPWLLYVIDIFMRETDARKAGLAGLGIALLTGSELLLGHPQVFWLSSLIEALYAILLAFSFKKHGRLFVLLVPKILGIMVGGAQLLPTWDAVANSIRPETFSRTWPAVHPVQLVQLIAPYFFKDQLFEGIHYELKAYNGAIPLALLVLLVIRRKQLGKSKTLAFGSFFLGALGLILSLGEYGYLYRIQAHIPFIGLLRAPCRYILLFHLASAVWSAIAFTHLSELVNKKDSQVWKKLWPLLLVPLVSIVPPLFSLWLKLHPHPTLTPAFVWNAASPAFAFIVGPVLFAIAAWVVFLGARGRKYALAGIILFAAADLGAYGISYMWSFSLKQFDSFLASRPVPSDVSVNRLKSDDNVLLMKGVRLTNGYSSIPPKRQLDDMGAARLKVAGASWLWSKRMEFLGGTTNALRLSRPLPRVRLVTRAIVSHNPNVDIKRIDVATTALVEETVDLVAGPAGKASLVAERPGIIKVATESPSRQFLVVSESYHEGWQVTVDGDEIPVARVYGDFMGCVVETGKHEVTFEFKPRSLYNGLYLSGAGLILSMIFCLAVARKKTLGFTDRPHPEDS
jgi:hypothetical protein